MGTSQTLSQFVWHYLKHKKRYLLCFALVALVWAIDISLNPYLLKVIVDKAVLFSKQQTIQIKSIIWPASLYVGMTVVVNLNFRLYEYCNLRLYPSLKASIERDLLRDLFDHSYTFFHNTFSGALTKKITDLMENIEPLITIPNEWFYPRVFAAVIASLTLFFVVSPVFGIILFLWAVIFVLLSYLAARQSEQYSRDFSENMSHLSGSVADSVGNVMTVKLFHNAEHEIHSIDAILDDVVTTDRRLLWFNLKINLLQGLAVSLLISAMLWALIIGLKDGSVSAGDFALVLTLTIFFTWSVYDMGKQMQRYSKVVGTCNQALSIIRQPQELRDVADAVPLCLSQGEIAFQNVSFHYAHRPMLFKKMTVTIKAGEKVGLVGYSGGGKSTFIKLILRLLDCQQGRITIDKQDITQVTQGSLRSQIATIPQEPELFHRTIKENIRIARRDASDEDIILASKNAHCHDFIMKLPQQYDSLVGERGVKLSGGQKQRIAIARAFLKNAPILLLDEATSSLDSKTEEEIHQALHEVMTNRTAIVIAHRLSTLKEMDRILVFVEGKIVEDGSLASLLKDKDGHFYALWQRQVDGFISD